MKRRALAVAAVMSLVASVILLSTGTAGAQQAFTASPLQPTGRLTADKAPTSRLAESDEALLARTDAALVTIMVKLDYDSVATYAGGVDDLAPTSPSVTGQPLTGAPAEQRYEEYAASQEAAFTAELQRRVPGAEVDGTLRTVYGGVTVTVPANRAEDVLAIDNVVAVQEDSLRTLLTDASPGFLGAPTLYTALGSTPNAGQGTILGNLDSGVWPEHPSFADLGNLPAPPGPARECSFGDNPLTPEPDPFACQHKLIGGAHFTDGYDAQFGDDPFAGTARDSEGHGTHTASTSAGNVVDNVSVLGSALSPIHGLAPGAYVMEYKVCGPQGCLDSDATDAVGQAIRDGVNVINFSISGGNQPFTDPVELAFLDAYAADVFVAASAGNSGPGAGTADHLSPWVTTVAASTQTREFATTLTVTAEGGETFTADGASITPGVSPLPVVLAGDAPYSNALCDAPAPAGTFTGMIVACQRGGNGRVEKGFNVAQGGAAGMILYNPTLADVETDTHWLPTVHLADGTALLAFLSSHTGEVASFPAGAARAGTGDVMAAFSSRGPGGNAIKPDVTAPGVQILAGDTPVSEGPGSGPAGELYQAIAGTSMSAPHVAGAALLLRALHPDWSPGQVRSALMTTATTAVVKEDLTTPADPFDRGAGRIDLNTAGSPGLTFDETAMNMTMLGNDPVNAVHLNIPSVNAPVLPGRLTTVRTATNVTGEQLRYEVETTAPAGSSITVTPQSFQVDPGGSVDLTITITSQAPTAQYFGEIRLVARQGGGANLHLPVAFVPQQGSVSLVSTCDPASVALQEASTCSVTAQNNAPTDTTADLATTVSPELRVTGATGATVTGERSVERKGVALKGSQPGVPAVAPGPTPAGYVPLDSLDVAPTPIGDEEILTFATPAFVFAGVTYNSIGVDSNGYLVAGPTTAEDNTCCNLTGLPDPARPNNVLAPFWTDLDGTGAPGVLVGEVTDGTSSWLVVEYRLNVFGTTSQRVFQTWVGLGGTEDITFTYPSPPADPNGQPFQVGAENVIGQGDVETVLPTTDLRVTSTDPTPGDAVTYTVAVQGQQPGTGKVTTTMNSPLVPGTTVVTSDVEVRSP